MQRGTDWDGNGYGTEDYHLGHPGTGNITDCFTDDGPNTAKVKWNNGQSFGYRIGLDGKYELKSVGPLGK